MFRPCVDAWRNNNIRNKRNLMTKTSVTILLCLSYTTTVLPFEFDDSGEENELFKQFQEEYGEDMARPSKKELLSDCREQTDATQDEADKFVKKEPQTTRHGKCYVACILTQGGLMKNDSINVEGYMKMSNHVYGEDSEIVKKLKTAMEECLAADVYSVEVCERASFFNDCMNLKSKGILNEAAVGLSEEGPFDTADERVDDRVEL